MIVIYNTGTGDIVYTIENKTNADFVNLKENQNMIITSNESVRANKYKVNLEKSEIEKIFKEGE